MSADRPDREPPRKDEAAPAAPRESAPTGATRTTNPKTKKKATKGEIIKRWARRAGIAVVLLAAAGMLAVAIVIRHFESDLPSTEELKSYHPPQVTRVLARDGTQLGELFVERRTLVPIAQIPEHVKYAVLAAEDASFYQHKGLDYPGMLRAILVNLRSSRARQGASTITQQVVKNVLLSQERTFDRKMREVILARRIEQELTKEEILELYLNHIYFGHGRYGIEEACRYYFGKSVREAKLEEAAMLAAVVKGPRFYSPRIEGNKDRALARRKYVLEQMRAKGFASPEAVEEAQKQPIVLAPEVETMSELAPEVVDEARRTLRSLVGDEADRGGYTITTTIDPKLQSDARKAVRDSLDAYLKRHKLLPPLKPAKKEPSAFDGMPKGFKAYAGVVTGHDDAKNLLFVRVGAVEGAIDLKGNRYNPRNLTPSQFAAVGKVLRVSLVDPKELETHAPLEQHAVLLHEAEGEAAPDEGDAPRPATQRPALRLEMGPQGALVAVDVKTHEIVALVGSYESVRGGLDRASNAHRQPGSTFKGFVYGYGIHTRKLTPATLLETNPLALTGYKPDNYDESEGQSPKRLREALAHSVNVAAVSALEQLGPNNVVAFAKDLGIESKLGADLSLALGAYEVTPREMVGAYAAFAAGGEYQRPRLVSKIVGPNGVEVKLPEDPAPKRVLEEPEAYVVTSLLKSVVDVGTATRALALGRPVAGKTGTSNQAKDAWFVGYTPDIACAVWTGFDDASPLGAGETGAVASLPAFVDFMREAHKGRPVHDFQAPAKGIVRVKIDPESGLLAWPEQENAIEEIFLEGTEPKDEAQPDGGVDASDDGGEAVDAGAEASAPESEPKLDLHAPSEGSKGSGGATP
jgi:penicillin-binding protein 1A